MKFEYEYTSDLLESVFSMDHSDFKELKSIATYFFDEVYLKIMIALYNQKFSTPHYLSKRIHHHKDPLTFRLSELVKKGLVNFIVPTKEDYPIYFKFWKELNSHTHSSPVFYTLSEKATRLLSEHKDSILKNTTLPRFEAMKRIGDRFEKFYEVEIEVQQAEQARREDLSLHTLAVCVACDRRILKDDVKAGQYGEFNQEIYCKECFDSKIMDNTFRNEARKLKEQGVNDPFEKTWKPKIK